MSLLRWLQIHFSTLVFWLLLTSITFYLYAPIIPLFFEGDDFLVLWYIQNPVPFLLKPFIGWHLPIAGRFGYGQAWYASAVFSAVGMNPAVFNVFGIIIRSIASIAIYLFVYNYAKRRVLAGLCAFVFVVLSTGIEGTAFAFHHFHLLFGSMVLAGLWYLLKAVRDGSWKWFFVALTILYLAGFLYTIRLGGLIAIPLAVLLYGWVVLKRPLISFGWGILCTFLLFGLIYATVPGISSVSGNLRQSVLNLLLQPGMYSLPYFESFFRSWAQILYPPHLIDLVKISMLRQVIWILLGGVGLMGAAEVVGYLQVRNIFYASLWKIFLRWIPIFLILILIGTLLVSRMIGVQLYSTLSYLKLVVLGYSGVCLLVYTSILMSYFNRKLGALAMISLLFAFTFYIPNWLFEPQFIAPTTGRYFTISSIFLAIMIGTIFYVLIFELRRYSFLLSGFSVILLVGYLIAHLLHLQSYVFGQTKYRNPEKTKAAWSVMRSTADFTVYPRVVMIWAEGDIADMAKMFHTYASFMLASGSTYSDRVPQQAISYEQAMNMVCLWRTQGLDVGSETIYLYRFTKQWTLIPEFSKNEEVYGTWKYYCDDPQQKGIEPHLLGFTPST